MLACLVAALVLALLPIAQGFVVQQRVSSVSSSRVLRRGSGSVVMMAAPPAQVNSPDCFQPSPPYASGLR
jgi:hypothetical protein